MAVPPEQAEVAAFLARLAEGAPIETHISAVFVGAETVWKLKKAVRLGFLDFAEMEDRRRFLARELEVNAGAAPGLYRDVVPVVLRSFPAGGKGKKSSLALGGEGRVIDWVLRMARVPEADFFEAIVARNALDAPLLDVLADAVAAFHAGLAPVHGTDPATAMGLVAHGNGRAALAAGLPANQVRVWLEAVLAMLATYAPLLRARSEAGFVRRAHGDLHLGNICLWHGRPTLFDALEFDEDLATIDLGYDLAFLLMDLDRRVGRAAANRVLGRALGRTGDTGLLALLPPFLSLRAMVRAHVEASRGRDGLGYLDAALAYLQPPPPLVVVAIGGLPGTGKTSFARALAPDLGAAPGALHVRSDEIRKRLHRVAPEQRLPKDAYTPAANACVDAVLIETVRAAAAAGHAVVADATFLDPALRQAVSSAGVPFLGVWLHAPVNELARRVAARTDDASDATIEVLHRLAARDVGAGGWLAVDACDPGALGTIRSAVRTAVPCA